MATDAEWEVFERRLSWLKVHADTMGKAEEAAGLDVEGAIMEAFWRTHGIALDAIAREVGDNDGWVQWFYWDNEMGAMGLEAGLVEDMQPVRTLADLRRLIEG
jgi:hypothetical protein